MNPDDLKKHIHDFWDSEIVPTLVDYIKIPNKILTIPLNKFGDNLSNFIIYSLVKL